MKQSSGHRSHSVKQYNILTTEKNTINTKKRAKRNKEYYSVCFSGYTYFVCLGNSNLVGDET